MFDPVVISILMTIVGAATPLLLAALGELVVEKSGVLNLGVEGMMLVGAVVGFAVGSSTGFALAGIVAAMIAATCASLIFGFLTLTLASNQVATGLALTIFGIGLSSMIGEGFVGTTIPPLAPVFPARLAGDPLLRLVFGHSILVYVSLVDDRRGGVVPEALARGADPAGGGRERSVGPLDRLLRDWGALRGGGVRRRDGGAGRVLLLDGADADVGGRG